MAVSGPLVRLVACAWVLGACAPTPPDRPETGDESAFDCGIDNGGCDVHATCTVVDGRRACVCGPGYLGDGTSCVLDACATSNGGCAPDADCVNVDGSGSCSCRAGFVGDGVDCEDVDECRRDHGGCSPDADCRNTHGSHSCTCRAGYAGDGITCVDVDECAVEHGGCAATAFCVNTDGSRECACRPGYAGDGVTCVDVDECATGNGGCSESARCTNTNGSRTCECVAGFAGDGVSCTDADECRTNNGGCSEVATCTNSYGSRTCACRPGYAGDGVTCADVDECATDNGGCSEDARCTNTNGSRACSCLPGYAGDGLACTDVDECATANGGCSADATCANTPGSRTCTCRAGFGGDGVSCTDVDECQTNDGGCPSTATCTNTPGSRICSCRPGHAGDGFTCVDVDECATDNGGCSENARCTNTNGSRSCSCLAGFAGDGITCVDVDECRTDNGGCPSTATCTNTPGSRTCACRSGYAGDGFICVDVDECATGNGGCSENARCTNTNGSRACSCLPGFEGDGLACADVDECRTNNGGCAEDATCTNTYGSRACACRTGYAGDGFTCVDVDECATDNGGCSVNARCTNTNGSRACACLPGYAGDGLACTDVDECATANGECSSDATCTNTPGSRSCACRTGFSGSGVTCTDVNECASGNGGCSTNAVCTNTVGSRACACLGGFTGDGVSCVDVDECASNHGGCAANAVCTNTPGSRTCACSPGYTGDGFTCSCTGTPTARAGSSQTVRVGDAYALDASASTGTAPLRFAWTGSTGAPALAGADTATPAARATECGTYTYTVTVTNACGRTATASVPITIAGDGPYVSNATCRSGSQCGTVSRPWCSIGTGISKTAVSPVRVAGLSSLPYAEPLVMRSGIDVEGGYEPTFSESRVTDPLVTPTRLLATGVAASFASGVDARLDGFRIEVSRATTTVPTTRTVVSVSSDATAVLANLSIDGPDTDPIATATTAVQVQGSGGGSLRLDNVRLRAPRAVTVGIGVATPAGSTGTLEIASSVIRAGVGTQTIGVQHLGAGPLDIARSTIEAGSGTSTSTGLVAGRDGYAGTTVDESVVEGGAGAAAIGIDHARGTLDIRDTVVSTTGLAATAAKSWGIRVDGASSVSLSGSTVRGSTVTGTKMSDTSIAVDLRNPVATGSAARITQSVLDGGTHGNERYGVLSDAFPVQVSGSDVTATSTAGAIRSVGVDLKGTYPAGAELILSGNAGLRGGQARILSTDFSHQSVGVRVTTTTPVTITGNERIEGCSRPCVSYAFGVLLYRGTGHVIADNDQILGGPGTMSYSGGHAGIWAESSAVGGVYVPAGATVRGNTLIAGNVDQVNRTEEAYGIVGRGADLVVEDNERIFGGYAVDTTVPVAGLRMYKPPYTVNQAPWHNRLDASRNLFAGGSSRASWGALLEQVTARMSRNVLDPCGIDGDGAPSPECSGTPQGYANTSVGLAVTGSVESVFVNNYIFGGHRAFSTACSFDCNGNNCQGGSEPVATFESNLCHSAGAAPTRNYGSISRALWVASRWFPIQPALVIRNNIFDPGTLASERASLFHDVLPAMTFANNDLVHQAPSSTFCYVRSAANTGYCVATLDGLHALSNATAALHDNVSVDPRFAAPQDDAPTAGGFALDGTCALRGLGAASTLVTTDFDGELRDVPEIGPDECP